VLLDIDMPELNGYELAARIRRAPALSSVVLVAVTGYGQASDRRRSEDATFDHHLVKPVDFPALEKITERLTCPTRCSSMSRCPR